MFIQRFKPAYPVGLFGYMLLMRSKLIADCDIMLYFFNVLAV